MTQDKANSTDMAVDVAHPTSGSLVQCSKHYRSFKPRGIATHERACRGTQVPGPVTVTVAKSTVSIVVVLLKAKLA